MSPVPLLAASDVAEAVRRLRAGGLIGLPTETVYGLAADADSAEAVSRIFTVKGRPADHPLIVHLASAADMSGWADAVPEYARVLAAAFWPGPMTLICRRSRRVGDWVTGGHATVGLRVPAHPVAHAVLAEFGGGLAAPSANRFGEVSPTTAADVLADLGELLDPDTDAVVEGGSPEVGLESTIIDCTGAAPRILRPGAITAAEVEAATGMQLQERSEQVAAPGTLASHYAPRARVRLTVAGAAGNPGSGFLALADVPTPTGMQRLASPADSAAYAQLLYRALRDADAMRLSEVWAVPPAGSDIAEAVRDRLTRAASE